MDEFEDVFEARLIEQEERYEKGADDKYDYPDPPEICECGGSIILVTDNNYGADADGRRGIKKQWSECEVCGEPWC